MISLRNVLTKHVNPKYYGAVLRIDKAPMAKTIKSIIRGTNRNARQDISFVSPHRSPIQRKMRGDKNKRNSILKIPKCRPRPDPNSGSGGGKLRFVRFCK